MSKIARIELFHVAVPLPASDDRRGALDTPTRPGPGFKINESILKKHGKRFFVMDRKRLILWSVRNRGIRVSREIDKVRKAKACKGLGTKGTP